MLPVKSSSSRHIRNPLFALALVLLVLGCACKRGALAKHEYMYVSAQETSLRDRVATMYNKSAQCIAAIAWKSSRSRGVSEGAHRRRTGGLDRGTQPGSPGRLRCLPEACQRQCQPAGASPRNRALRTQYARDPVARRQSIFINSRTARRLRYLKRATAEKNPPKAAAIGTT